MTLSIQLALANMVSDSYIANVNYFHSLESVALCFFYYVAS